MTDEQIKRAAAGPLQQTFEDPHEKAARSQKECDPLKAQEEYVNTQMESHRRAAYGVVSSYEVRIDGWAWRVRVASCEKAPGEPGA